MRFLLPALLVIESFAVAQSQTIVSPLVAANVEGSSNQAFPWNDARQRRYMQIHSDLGNTPKLVRQLAFRKDAGGTPVAGSRTIDFELFLGHSVAWDSASFVFNNNYITPRTAGIARKMLNIGPLSGTGSPAPFEIVMLLDQPFVYVGAFSLAWEAVVYSNTLNGVFTQLDAEVGTITVGTAVYTGTGCIASTQTLPMAQTLQYSDVCGGFSMAGYLRYGPPNAPTLLYIGSTNPNLTVPGVCGAIYTNLLVALPLGVTDATGYLGETLNGVTLYPGGAFAIALANTFAGAVLTTQVHSIDVGSTQPVPIANSNGATVTVPAPNLTRVCKLTRLWNYDGGTTAANSVYANNSTIGYGLVTEFTY